MKYSCALFKAYTLDDAIHAPYIASDGLAARLRYACYKAAGYVVENLKRDSMTLLVIPGYKGATIHQPHPGIVGGEFPEYPQTGCHYLKVTANASGVQVLEYFEEFSEVGGARYFEAPTNNTGRFSVKGRTVEELKTFLIRHEQATTVTGDTERFREALDCLISAAREE